MSRSTQIVPRRRLLQKNAQTLFELVRRIQNTDVFKKNLIEQLQTKLNQDCFKVIVLHFQKTKFAYFKD